MYKRQIQLDLKIRGISSEIIRDALAQSKEARLEILRKMLTAKPRPSEKLSPHAPRLMVTQIQPDKIGMLIGPGGKNIRAIQEETETVIEVAEDGKVVVSGTNGELAELALKKIEACTATVQIGKIYDGVVSSTKDFGAFVEILPGRDGLCHISELSSGFISDVSEVCAIGDEMKVLVIDVDGNDRVKLSRRRALEELGLEDEFAVEEEDKFDDDASDDDEFASDDDDFDDRGDRDRGGSDRGGSDRGGRGGSGRGGSDRGGRGGSDRGGRGRGRGRGRGDSSRGDNDRGGRGDSSRGDSSRGDSDRGGRDGGRGRSDSDRGGRGRGDNDRGGRDRGGRGDSDRGGRGDSDRGGRGDNDRGGRSGGGDYDRPRGGGGRSRGGNSGGGRSLSLIHI